MGLTVALTGVNSYFAGTVLPLLEADPEIERIVGVDVTPWRGASKKMDFRQEDVRSPRMAEILKGADVVCHLAYIVGEIHDKKKTRDVNINGSRNVFEACRKNGVKKVVYTSSLTAYGSHPDTPLGLTEEAPLAGNKDSYYASSKVEVESFARDFFKNDPNTTLTVLRAALCVGPRMNNQFSDFWSRKVSIFPAGRQAHMQLIHEEDLGEALHLAVKKDLPGVYNVAADDALPTRWMFETAGVKLFALPPAMLKPIANLAFALHLEKVSQGWLSLSEYTIYVNCDKFKQAAGWKAKRSSKETFHDWLRSRR